MPTLVTTGQITIVDQNDAKPVTAFIGASSSLQQVYSKEGGTPFVPSYFTTPLVLQAFVYVGTAGGAVDVTSSLINKRWAKSVGGSDIFNGAVVVQDGTSFVNNVEGAVAAPFAMSNNNTTLTISGNLKPALAAYPIYFEGDYVDPDTGLIIHAIAQVQLGIVSTGSNAVFITMRGQQVIRPSMTSSDSRISIAADLIRAGGTVDRTDVMYKWYQISGGTTTQITTTTPTGSTTKFGIADTATGVNPTATAVNTNLPTAGNGNSYNNSGVGNGNTLVISELAIQNLSVFRVDIQDMDGGAGPIYSTYFTITDVNDPYTMLITSTTGDKILNGTGSTTLVPLIRRGIEEANTTGWTYLWTHFDREGNRAAFVDTAATGHNGGAGRSITSNTATVFSHSTTTAVPANSIVKCVSSSGAIVKYFEVASSTTTSFTVKTTNTLGLHQYTAVSTEFNGGKFLICTASGTRATSSIVLQHFDVDGRSTVKCEASKPI